MTCYKLQLSIQKESILGCVEVSFLYTYISESKGGQRISYCRIILYTRDCIWYLTVCMLLLTVCLLSVFFQVPPEYLSGSDFCASPPSGISLILWFLLQGRWFSVLLVSHLKLETWKKIIFNMADVCWYQRKNNLTPSSLIAKYTKIRGFLLPVSASGCVIFVQNGLINLVANMSVLHSLDETRGQYDDFNEFIVTHYVHQPHPRPTLTRLLPHGHV